MFRKLLLAVAALLLLPVLLVAQDGKLRGKVTDKESGEALIGANVTVEGTNLGAATDVNGEYVILSVPPGVYTVKVTYIGYSPVTYSNVEVNASLTKTQNFAMSSSAVQVQGVEIVAERPLIQRNTTNTIRIQTQSDVQSLPFRAVSDIVSLSAGVVSQAGNMYVRGGRSGEVAYFVDGANVTDPTSMSQTVSLIRDALQEVQLQSGGFTAEFGGANSGIVRSSMRTGGSQLRFSVDYLTDDFAKSGRSFLGTTSRGYKNAVGTVSGPIMTGVRFFLADQYNYTRNGQSIFLTPFDFETLTQDEFGAPRKLGDPLPGPVKLLKNNSPNATWNWNNTAQANLLFDMAELAKIPMKIRVSGNYSFANSINGGYWPGGLANIFLKPDRMSRNDANTAFGNLRLTHFLSQTTFYEIGLSYTRQWGRTYDKTFGDNFLSYEDSAANVNAGYVGFNGYGWRSRYNSEPGLTTIYNWGFTDPDQPNNAYSKYKQNQIAVTLDMTSQISSRWELKAGGSIENWTYRTYTMGNIAQYLRWIDPNQDGVPDPDNQIYAGDLAKGESLEMARRARTLQQGTVTAWGYDPLGNETNGYTVAGSSTVWDKPYSPTFANAYIQNKIEYQDLVLNFGLRYEYSYTDVKQIPATINPLTGQYDNMNPDGLDQQLNILDASTFTRTKANNLLLPRISFSFPVTDRTIFFAQYGKYAQMPSLGQLYRSDNGFQTIANPNTRSPYSGSAPWLVTPERTTQFEVGFRQYVTDNLAFSLNGFYKDTKNLIQLRRVYNSLGNPEFTGYQNEDFATTKGLELSLELRRTNRLSARLNYTLSDAEGTGAASGSNSVATSDELRARFPNFTAPLPYNQTHRGNLTFDYRYAKGEGGSILEGMGLYVLMSFNSGHNFTKIEEPTSLGQASPWNVGVNALRDARSRTPVEPANASTTPWIFNIDLNLNKVFYFTGFQFEIYANVLNVLNTKQVVNVYPTTGTPFDDGWLKSPNATAYKAIPNYEAFYRAINLDNRWGMMTYYGDVYGQPRQIRVGARAEF
jgi:outer membrane receptor protein involved in Fe transport